MLSDSAFHDQWLRSEATSPSLTDAVHWLIDDTRLDTKSAVTLVPELFISNTEAAAVDAAVEALLAVLENLGPTQPDLKYVEHNGWARVVDCSADALAILAK